MKGSLRLLQLFALLAALVLSALVTLADTIRLKDGTVLKGKVITYGQRKFVITVSIGGSASQYSVPVEEVESVEFDGDLASGSRIQAQGSTPTDTTSSITRAPISPPREVARPASEQGEPAPSIPAPTTEPVRDSAVGDANTGLITTIAEKTVSVAAANDWSSTEIRVQKGQRIVINANGEVDLGNGQRSGPEGTASNDARKLMIDRPTGSLIAVVGDDNDDFVFVGNSTEFTSKHNGILFLSINEGNLKDNAGAFVARVKVLSNR